MRLRTVPSTLVNEEHLQKQGEAQQSVPEANLVEAVRAVLARHRVAAER